MEIFVKNIPCKTECCHSIIQMRGNRQRQEILCPKCKQRHYYNLADAFKSLGEIHLNFALDERKQHPAISALPKHPPL